MVASPQMVPVVSAKAARSVRRASGILTPGEPSTWMVVPVLAGVDPRTARRTAGALLSWAVVVGLYFVTKRVAARAD